MQFNTVTYGGIRVKARHQDVEGAKPPEDIRHCRIAKTPSISGLFNALRLVR